MPSGKLLPNHVRCKQLLQVVTGLTIKTGSMKEPVA